MMKWEEFDTMYKNGSSILKGYRAKTVYDRYRDEVYPFLPVISEFFNRDNPATIKQICLGIGINPQLFNVMRDVFPELQEVIEEKSTYAQLSADLMLMKGVVATEHKNPKMIEMFQHRYNDKYKPKGGTEVTELPTVKIEFVDAGLSEQELADKFGQNENENL